MRSEEVDLENIGPKSGLIVGGGSGSGFAAAKAMLKGGAKVWIVVRSRAKLEAAPGRLEAGDSAGYLVVDMTDSESVSQALSQFETESLDALIFSASSAVYGPFETLSVADAQSMFESKFWAPYRAAQQAGRSCVTAGPSPAFPGFRAAGRA